MMPWCGASKAMPLVSDHDVRVDQGHSRITSLDVSTDKFPASYFERRGIFYENHDLQNCRTRKFIDDRCEWHSFEDVALFPS